MRHTARFWRNVTLVGILHVVAVIALLRWASGSKITSAEEITWLNAADEAIATADPAKAEETPTPEPVRQASPADEQQPAAVPTKSEIELPTATPFPTAAPLIMSSPSPKPTSKPIPKKKASPKPSTTPERKKPYATATPAKNKASAKTLGTKKDARQKSDAKSGEKTAGGGGKAGGSVQPNATADSTNASWYGNMLHDRFYREWAQPTTVLASGAKLSALAKVRIEKDGRIADFKIVRSSGNVVVDESVQAVGKKVTRVDPLPAGIGGGGHYEVNINFALNSE
jgi:TonB family protein